jgi:hypothetical protein
MRVSVGVGVEGAILPIPFARTVVRVLLSATVALGGCAHERTAGREYVPRAGDPSPGLVRVIERTAAGEGTTCARETPVGSRVPRAVCRSAQERQRQRERSDGLLEDLRRAGTGP